MREQQRAVRPAIADARPVVSEPAPTACSSTSEQFEQVERHATEGHEPRGFVLRRQNHTQAQKAILMDWFQLHLIDPYPSQVICDPSQPLEPEGRAPARVVPDLIRGYAEGWVHTFHSHA